MLKTLALLGAMAVVAGPAQAQRLAPGQPLGSIPANLQLEITDAPAAETTGVLKRGTVVAQHTLRVSDAVVLEADAAPKTKKLPAGTPLARVEFAPAFTGLIDGKGRRTAWCDVRGVGAFAMGNIACLADADGDGRFDEQLIGYVDQHFFSFVIDTLAPAGALAAPVAYRPAQPQERPSAVVGYRYCDGDNVASPPRFATVVRLTSEKSWRGVSENCSFGVWPDGADHSRLVVDAVELKLGPGAPPSYQMTRGMAAGPIGPLRPGQSVEQAQARPNPKARFQAAVETLTRSPLKPVGAAQVRTGAVARGDAVVTVPVAHAITGRLKNQVRSKGLLAAGAAPLEIGQPVYGITTPYGGLYWCAPRQVEKDGRPQWTGVCLPDAGGATRWIPATPALFPTYTFGVSGNTSAADTPSVAPEPIDFGAPMTLEYRFAGWNKKYANIELHVRSAAGSGLVSYTYPSREADGSATLALMGGKVTISPAADGKGATVAVAEPLAAEGRLPF